jgi:hypothetical protein
LPLGSLHGARHADTVGHPNIRDETTSTNDMLFSKNKKAFAPLGKYLKLLIVLAPGMPH